MSKKDDTIIARGGYNQPPGETVSQIPGQRTGYNPPTPAAPTKPIIPPSPPPKKNK
jgi:hypothetical protein